MSELEKPKVLAEIREQIDDLYYCANFREEKLKKLNEKEVF